MNETKSSDEIKVEPKAETISSEKASTSRLSNAVDVPHYLPLSSMMGINQPTTDEQDQLKTVWEYFSDQDSTASRLYAIKNTLNRMGGNSLGQSDLSKIFNYVTLRKDIEEKEKLLNEL